MRAKDLKPNCMYEVQRFNFAEYADFTEYIKAVINDNSHITFHYLNNDPDLLHYITHSDFDETFAVVHELAPVKLNNGESIK